MILDLCGNFLAADKLFDVFIPFLMDRKRQIQVSYAKLTHKDLSPLKRNSPKTPNRAVSSCIFNISIAGQPVNLTDVETFVPARLITLHEFL